MGEACGCHVSNKLATIRADSVFMDWSTPSLRRQLRLFPRERALPVRLFVVKAATLGAKRRGPSRGEVVPVVGALHGKGRAHVAWQRRDPCQSQTCCDAQACAERTRRCQTKCKRSMHEKEKIGREVQATRAVLDARPFSDAPVRQPAKRHHRPVRPAHHPAHISRAIPPPDWTIVSGMKADLKRHVWASPAATATGLTVALATSATLRGRTCARKRAQ